MNANRVLVCLVVFMSTTFPVLAQKGKPGGGGTSSGALTSRIVVPADPDTGVVPDDPSTLGPRILSDEFRSGTDAYTTNGKTGTTSEFDSDGDWRVASGTTSRAFFVDLGLGSLFHDQYVDATIFTYCKNNGLTPVASLKGVGASTTCPMLFRIGGPDKPTFYRLAFNSYKRPGAGDVTFTCEAVRSATDSTCVRFRGTPADNDYGTRDGRSTARLYKVTSATRKTPEVEQEIGDYDVIFDFIMTR
jgi:hypothetical protein